MNALLFPGQGSQLVGMGSELFTKFELVKKIFKKADEKLNFPISKLILEGPEKDLQLTKNTQPAILTVSYSIFKVIKEEFDFDFKNFKFFAGHSLGEYSALVCAEALKFEDALYLLRERGKAMQESVPVGKGKMIATLGSSIDEIIKLINLSIKEGKICEIANDNSDGQLIISGDTESVDSFIKFLKEKKIKFIPLKVSAPFHCSLMEPAAEIMKDKIYNTNFTNPIFKIVNNVTANPEIDVEKIKDLLIKQIYTTVRWRESIITMHELGVKNFVEIGPGKVLSGMVKRTIKDARSFPINTIADIKNLENEFKK
tara:strand:+ start:10959 stop:11900 length:942 start_codon:yes stop_codon:yes gene_type:complete